VIENLIGKGIRIYDFLGEMSIHKERWHATERSGSHIMIGNRKMKNRILYKNNVWPTGRYLKHAEVEWFRGMANRNEKEGAVVSAENVARDGQFRRLAQDP